MKKVLFLKKYEHYQIGQEVFFPTGIAEELVKKKFAQMVEIEYNMFRPKILNAKGKAFKKAPNRK